MCGRFTLRAPARVLVEHFRLDSAPQLSLRFNIAPTQEVAAVRAGPEGKRTLSMLRWGLIPSWAKDPSIAARMINARGETVAEKPSFRTALRKRRCLIPADGYYEWKKEGKEKRPFHIHLPKNRVFAFAGLWESWSGGGRQEGEPGAGGKNAVGESAGPLETCTIITTDANDATRGIHDRMPVILDESDYDEWLNASVQDGEQLQHLLVPYEGKLATDEVSRFVNNPRNDDPRCLAGESP
jgi:putative SOS response-associated peptidase YedK